MPNFRGDRWLLPNFRSRASAISVLLLSMVERCSKRVIEGDEIRVPLNFLRPLRHGIIKEVSLNVMKIGQIQSRVARAISNHDEKW